MSTPITDIDAGTRLMAYSGAAMYAGGALIGLIGRLIPGGAGYTIVPVFIALGLAAGLAGIGPHLPRWALAPLGWVGVALTAAVLASMEGPSDAAVLYMLPVIWSAYFFGRRGAIAVVCWIGIAHGYALVVSSESFVYIDRWVDVMVATSIVAGVVEVLRQRNVQLLDRIAAEARTDPLTRLLNRRGLAEHAQRCIAHSHRDGSPLAVATFDLDFFKKINDEWGHDLGDQVLIHMASILTTHSRDIDIVARVGGEEFVVLLPRCTAPAAELFTDRVREALRSDSSDLPPVRVSAGVSTAVAPRDVSRLMHQADEALYAAKRNGRNRTVVFTPDQALT